VIVVAVASFLNSYQGGDLLIGVADDGTIRGLSYDFQTFNEPKDRSRDGYYRWLTELLFNAFGFDLSPYVDITFHEVDDKYVCRVRVTPAPTLVWLEEKDKHGMKQEKLYVRVGAGKRGLTAREAVGYATNRQIELPVDPAGSEQGEE